MFHLLLSKLCVKKVKILFCLLAEIQGVPGHEFPPYAENCVYDFLLSSWGAARERLGGLLKHDELNKDVLFAIL